VVDAVAAGTEDNLATGVTMEAVPVVSLSDNFFLQNQP